MQVLRRMLVDQNDNAIGSGQILNGDYAMNALTHPHDDFFMRVARRDFPEITSEFRTARSVAINDTESVIWDGGGIYTFLNTAEKMSVVSASGEDAVGGSGVSVIAIVGLDGDYNPISEQLTLTGDTPVLTTKKYIRVSRIVCLKSGTEHVTLGNNVGQITVTSETSEVVQAIVREQKGQTLMGIYTVPAGCTGFVTHVSFSCGQGKQCTFRIKVRPNISGYNAFAQKHVIELYQNSHYGALVPPLALNQKSDAIVTGVTSSGTIDATMSFSVMTYDSVFDIG